MKTFKKREYSDRSREARVPVPSDPLEATIQDLTGERNKRSKDRMPLFEAYLECQIKVLSNEKRKANGLPAEYRAAY